MADIPAGAELALAAGAATWALIERYRRGTLEHRTELLEAARKRKQGPARRARGIGQARARAGRRSSVLPRATIASWHGAGACSSSSEDSRPPRGRGPSSARPPLPPKSARYGRRE